ncbi:MAG: hypothetical protein EP340_04090 [Alphaproteobacteria bacterium]|nr:MAG: hypothetical protein EP340_04090 [Alphaproteobacteria bacterium]
MYPTKSPWPWLPPLQYPSLFGGQPSPSPQAAPAPTPSWFNNRSRKLNPPAPETAPIIPPRMNRLPTSLDEVPASVADLPPMTEADARSLPKDVYYDLFGSAHPSLVPVMVAYDRAERNNKLMREAQRKAQALGGSIAKGATHAYDNLGRGARQVVDMEMQAARAIYDASRPLAQATYEAAEEAGEAVYEFAGDVASMAEDFALYFQAAPYEEKQEFLLLLGEFVVSLNPTAALAIEIHHFISDPEYRTIANVVMLAASLIPAFRAIRKVPALARLVKRFIDKGRRLRRHLEADLQASERARAAMRGNAKYSDDIIRPKHDRNSIVHHADDGKAAGHVLESFRDWINSPQMSAVFARAMTGALEGFIFEAIVQSVSGSNDPADLNVAAITAAVNSVIGSTYLRTATTNAIGAFAQSEIGSSGNNGTNILQSIEKSAASATKSIIVFAITGAADQYFMKIHLGHAERTVILAFIESVASEILDSLFAEFGY